MVNTTNMKHKHLTMKHLSILILLLSVLASVTRASDGLAKDSTGQRMNYITGNEIIWSGLGFGWGLDYGGIGANYTAFVSKNVGIFAGGGFAYADFGYNFGLKLRMIPRREGSKLNPFVLGMWGVNQAFTSDTTYLSKVYTGFTVGIGTDFKAKPQSKGYWSVALLVPFMSEDEKYYADWLDKNFRGRYQTWLHNVAFSIGYHYILKGR